MNRAFRVREGAEGFDETLWGKVFLYNEEMAQKGLTELTAEDLGAALANGDVEEVEWDQEEADRLIRQIEEVVSEGSEGAFFSTHSQRSVDLPIYDGGDRRAVGELVLDFIERARDEADLFSLIIHVDARLGALPKYGPADVSTTLLLHLRLSSPVASPLDDDPLAVSDYVVEFGVKLERSSFETNRHFADEFCGWLTRGLAGQGCVVDFTGLD